MRVTAKQVKEQINYWLQNNSVDELQIETIKVLKDLSKFPQENKHQIRFYFKVLETLITKYE
jgi:phenylacetate-coenzyme A ligase PaaK-like adenylate-forming protein